MRSWPSSIKYGTVPSCPASSHGCCALPNKHLIFKTENCCWKPFWQFYLHSHNMKKFTLFIALLCLLEAVKAQTTEKAKLIAGPVIGAVTKNTAKIWIAYRGKGQNALILGDTAEKRVYYPTNVSYITDAKGDVALTMDFTGLKPDHRYNILVSIEGWGANARYSFKTQADTPVKDFSFLLGSCALLNMDITRIFFPAGSNWIFYRMKKTGGDFMLWLGDNIYYIYKKQYSSYEHMFKRQLDTRKFYRKFYRDFLANQPNYAIWDDHDYGPNDSDRRFGLKDSSMKVFKGFWPNTYPDQGNFKGTTSISNTMMPNFL